MDKANTIKFQILYKLKEGQQICIRLFDCIQYQDLAIPLECNAEIHDHTWSKILEFLDSSMSEPIQTLRYTYFVTKYGDQNNKIRDILDEFTGQPIMLSFSRLDYYDCYLSIFDRCDYQTNPSARLVEKLQLNQIVTTTIKIKQNIPMGRWLFMFMINDIDPQTLQKDSSKSKDQKNALFWSEKMERHLLPSNEQLWIYRRVTNLAALEKNNKFIFSIFQSYYYNRQKKIWKVKGGQQLPNFLEGQFDDIERLAEILDKNNIKYQIVESSNSGQQDRVLQNGLANQIPKDTDFVYQVTDDIEKRTIFTVYLVLKNKGTFKMEPDSQKRLWHVSVFLTYCELTGLEYYFELNIIGAIQKYDVVTIGSANSKKTNQIRRTLSQRIEKVKSNARVQVYSNTPSKVISHTHSSYLYNSYYTTPTYLNQGSWGSKLPHQIPYFTSNMANFNSFTYSSSSATSTSSSSGSYCIPATFSYVPSSHRVQRRNGRSYSYSTYKKHENRTYNNYGGGSSKTNINSNYKSIYGGRGGIGYSSGRSSGGSGRNGSSGGYGSTGGNSGSRGSGGSGNGRSSSGIGSNNCGSYYSKAYSSFNSTSGSSSVRQYNSSVVNNLISHTTNLSTSSNVSSNFIESNNKVITYLKNVQNFYQEADQLKSKISSLSELNLQQVDNIIFTQEYGPIALQIIEELKMQEIQDDFKKGINQLTPKAGELRQKLQQAREIRNMQDNTEDHMTQNNFNILSINILTAAKLWGKQNYTSYHRVNDLLKKYLPEAEPRDEKHEKQIIINSLYYLNDYVHNKKQYTWKVQHPAPRSCQKNIQQKVYQHLGSIRSTCSKPFEFVESNEFYKLLVRIVDMDIKRFVEFGKNNGLEIKTDQISQNLMRVLIDYAIIYSLGYYCNNNISKFDVSGCGQFGPFCTESDQRFLSRNLMSIRDKYEQVNSKNQNIYKQAEAKLNNIQNQVTKIVENAVQKEAISFVQIEYDVKKIRQYFLKHPNRKQFFLDVDLRDTYEKDLKSIDDCKNKADKIAKIRDLKNHKYIRGFESFY